MGVTAGFELAAFLLLPLSKSFGCQISFLTAAIILLVIVLILYMLYKEPQQVPDEKGNLKKPNGYDFRDLIALLKHKGLMLITFSAMLLSGMQMILNIFIIIFTYEL